MECPQCKHENPEHAKFCLECGAGLVAVCLQCGTEVPPGAGSCISCGASLGAPVADAAAERARAAVKALQRLAPKGYAERLLATRGQVQPERRTVTILFSDVKGSTTMAEGLDPEDVLDIMRGTFDVLIAPVYRYEGTLARLMGDAILAFFGAPIAHEDDPERACRAALEIIAGAQQYAQRLEEERGISGFNVRVGINTGLVVVGEVGSDLRVEYTAMGDAINLAARMESAAEPGTVWITEDTHKLIAPLFETEALGPVQVKGKAEPVSVFRVLAAREVPRKPRGIAGLESPLVGRGAELAALQEALNRLQAGVGGIVTLAGEAGIGKSRLVAEVRNLPHVIASPYSGEAIPNEEGTDCFGEKMPRNDRPTQWVEGRCLSYGHSVAYLLWLDVLRGLLGVTLEHAPHAVRERLREQVQAACPDRLDDVYPYLARLMSLPLAEDLAAKMDDMDGQDLKAHTFQALQTLIECATSQQPLVLVCEDLHWADPTSMELLQQVLPLIERTPLLLLCVFRPLKDHACWRFREVAAQTYAQRHTDLLLQPLSSAESQTLVANLLRVEDLPQVLRERILSRAEGNPFYVEEVVRSLIDRGAIVQDQQTGRWTATREVADIPIPDTLQGVLMARIDRLQEDTKRVLQMASVIGRIFLYRVLAAIAEEERRLDEHLWTLQYQEMIRERARIPELEYIFKHDLTREAAYNGLLRKQRRAFHRQVAEAMERLFPERAEEQLGLLAHHWERSGDAQEATEYLLRAGDQARNAYAHQEAIDYYERALSFLKQQGAHERAARTMMKLGLTYHTAYAFRESRQAYEEGFALWQQAVQAEPAVPPAPAPHALRMPWSDGPIDPSVLHPQGDSIALIMQLFSGLVEWSQGMDVVPDVARSWEVLDGGRRYVFHLRDDVSWSDGRPVTAGDFVYAWKRVLDPATGSPGAELLEDVRGAGAFHRGECELTEVGVQAIDEFTLVVELEGPTGYFLHLLDLPTTYPVPRHAVQAHGEAWTEVGNIVTNGPFQLQAGQPGQSMVLARNPLYHGRRTGNVQRLEVSLVLGSPGQLEMYEADELDVLFVWGLPVPDWSRPQVQARVKQRHAEEYFPVPWPSVNGVVFDVTRPPFDDVRVRRAFVLATDRETLAAVALGGFGSSTATGGFVPRPFPGHSPGIALPYDPQQAQQLLAEAGYPSGRGFPPVHAFAWPDRVRWSEHLHTQWRANLGVDIPWRLGEWSTFYGPGELPQLWFDGWRFCYPDPDYFLRLASPARFGWRNEEYDNLVEQARREMDPAQRMKLYRQADRMLIEEAVILPTHYGRASMLVKPWVKKLPMTTFGWWLWKNVVIEPH
jgi:ABC-type oligopeptide transport system substrate-binding subunit/class 3 adenylate cyclase